MHSTTRTSLNSQKWVKPARSVILIADNLAKVNSPADNREIQSRTLGWLKAWKERNVEAYSSFYSDRFKHQGRSKHAYIRYKSRLFQRYRKMEVAASNMRVLSHDKYSIAIMNQNFRGDHFTAKGSKLLYWKKEGSEWKNCR